MEASFKNVHEFDGKLPIPELKKFTVDEKLEMIKIFIPKLKNQNAINILKSMSLAMINNTKDNQDDSNDVDAMDILANILANDYDNILSIFEEQLADIITLGQCPQGRTTRLLQIYNIVT